VKILLEFTLIVLALTEAIDLLMLTETLALLTFDEFTPIAKELLKMFVEFVLI
jgi:hypothetical protein